MSEMKSLPAIIGDANNVVQAILDNSGEITPEIENALQVVEASLTQKADQYSFLIERLEFESEYWKAKAQEFNKIAQACTTARERMKDRIKVAMNILGLEEINGKDVRFKLQKSNPKLVIEDESKIDAAYKTVISETVIDKERVKEDLRLGVPVAGAKLEQGFSLRTYANSAAAQKKKAVST